MHYVKTSLHFVTVRDSVPKFFYSSLNRANPSLMRFPREGADGLEARYYQLNKIYILIAKCKKSKKKEREKRIEELTLLLFFLFNSGISYILAEGCCSSRPW